MIVKINETQKKVLTKGWKEKNGQLHKKFSFESFNETIDFVNKVAEIAKKQNHHPELIVKYDSVDINIFDHEENKISDKCIKFVNSVNSL